MNATDAKPGGPLDGGREGTTDGGPEGVLQVRRGRVHGVGADEARVHAPDVAANGLQAAADGGVPDVGGGQKGGGGRGLGSASRVRDDDDR